MPHRAKPPHAAETVFVDTSAIAAVMNKSDAHHEKAIVSYKQIVEQGYSLVITNFVIAETHALLLRATHNSTLSLRWLQEVAYTDFTVIRPSKIEEDEAIRLLTTYHDKQWSMVDALSFIIMEKVQIPYYFSFDDDFKQIGTFLDINVYIEKN